MPDAAVVPSTEARRYPAFGKASLALIVLVIVSTQAQLDRQLPGLLVTPIRAAFHISDTQMSFLQGFSFAFLYAVMGPVFGRYVDRASRRNLIIGGVIVWSGMTIWSAYAQTYWELFVSRTGMGIGEAVLAPAAYSLIADLVEPGKRGRALSIYTCSHALGTGISLLMGGWVIGALGSSSVHIPILGDFAPWQATFLFAGLPGIFAALLMLLISEPARQEDGSIAVVDANTGSYREFFDYVRANAATFTLIISAYVSTQFIGNALFPWKITFFLRRFDVQPQESGPILAALMIGGSLLGFIVSGILSDRWFKRGDPAGRIRPMLFGLALLIPALIAWPIVNNSTASFLLLGLVNVAYTASLGTLPTVMQQIVPNRMRGKATTLTLLMTTLIGWGAGPTVVALFTDYVFKNDAALGYSLAASTVPAAALALVLGWLAMRPYVKTFHRLHGGGEDRASAGLAPLAAVPLGA